MAVRAEPKGGPFLVVLLLEPFEHGGALAAKDWLASGHRRGERNAGGDQGREQTDPDFPALGAHLHFPGGQANPLRTPGLLTKIKISQQIPKCY